MTVKLHLCYARHKNSINGKIHIWNQAGELDPWEHLFGVAFCLLSFNIFGEDQQFHSAFCCLHHPSHFPVRCAETTLRVLESKIFLKQLKRQFVTNFHQSNKYCTLTWLLLGRSQYFAGCGGEGVKAHLESDSGEMGGLGTTQIPNLASKC